jgi:Fe-S cluster biosynthesis and repair protein YggX
MWAGALAPELFAKMLALFNERIIDLLNKHDETRVRWSTVNFLQQDHKITIEGY